MKQSPSSGGMKPQDAATVEIRDNVDETIPVFGWGWPAEALLADMAEMVDWMAPAQRPIEDDAEYVNLYFVS
jgi:hypothetical protein